VLLDPVNSENDFLVYRRLLRESMRQTLPEQFEADAWEIVDHSQMLDLKPSIASPLAAGVKFYKAANIQMRKFGTDDVFLEVIPKSSIQYTYDLDTLLRNSLLTSETAQDVFPFVKLASNAVAKLVGVLPNKTASDPIENDEVLHGRTFLQFAKDVLPNVSLLRPDARLMGIGIQTGPKVYSSEILHPSINFTLLKYLAPDFFSRFLSRLRLDSMKGLDNAVEWAKSLFPLLRFPNASETLEVEPHLK
jgi:hypothetical protein